MDVIESIYESLALSKIEPVLDLRGDLPGLVDDARLIQNIGTTRVRPDLLQQIRVAGIARIHEHLPEKAAHPAT